MFENSYIFRSEKGFKKILQNGSREKVDKKIDKKVDNITLACEDKQIEAHEVVVSPILNLFYNKEKLRKHRSMSAVPANRL